MSVKLRLVECPVRQWRAALSHEIRVKFFERCNLAVRDTIKPTIVDMSKHMKEIKEMVDLHDTCDLGENRTLE